MAEATMSMNRIYLQPDSQLRAAIEAERHAIAKQTGLRPSLSETASALVRRALAAGDRIREA